MRMVMRYCSLCKTERPVGHEATEHPAALFGPDAPQATPEVEHDLVEGRRLRDQGTAKVSSHTPDEYRELFERQVRDFAQQRRDFTSEDITARIGQPPNHPNAVGALTRAVAIKYGARKVGRVQAQRKNQHATEIALWGWR